MNSLTQQYQNYRNQLGGITNVNDQLETIKNNIVSQHIQDWEDIKDKWDKATEIGTEAASVLGMFRLGQKFKAGLKSKADELKGKLEDGVEDLKGKGQNLIDSAQEQVDNVVSVAKDKADGLVGQGMDAMEKAQGTMADLTGAGQEAVDGAKASLGDLQNMVSERVGNITDAMPDLGSLGGGAGDGLQSQLGNMFKGAGEDVVAPSAQELEAFPAIETEMTAMKTQPSGLTMEELARQFPAETLQRPSGAGGGQFELGFTGRERSLLPGAEAEAPMRGSLPQRLPASGVSSGATHSQPEQAPVESGELDAVQPERTYGLIGRIKQKMGLDPESSMSESFSEARSGMGDLAGAEPAGGELAEKTMGLWGRLKAGLFSGKSPLQETFPSIGSPQEVMSQLKSAGADLGGDVAKAATGAAEDVGADVAAGAVEAGAEAAEAGLGTAAGLASAIPGVGEVLGLATAVAGFVGSFASEGQEESAEKQNPLTKTSFSQFNVIPTLSSMASQPSTPGVF